MQEIEIDALPRHSSWPARLLGLEDFEQRVKTKAEIDREYGRDKWGSLLAELDKDPGGWTLQRADEFFLGGTETAFSEGERLYAGDALAAHERYLAAIEQRLAPFLPAHTVVELGAGYGSVMLGLARRKAFGDASLIGAEYAASGVQCLSRLAQAEGLRADAGGCDFTLPRLTELDIRPGALVYTCMAVPCVPELPDSFVDGLVRLRPAVVVHIEPCIEHFGTSLLGLLRTRYTQLNDYNRNLLSLLRRRESAGDLRILAEEKCFFGENCLMPCSLVAWVPTGHEKSV